MSGFGTKSEHPEPIVIQFMLGGSSSATAAIATHPLDLIKVRQQLKGTGNILNMAFSVVKNDGAPGLYKGLSASLVRQLTYSSARIGSYGPIKNALQGEDEFPSLIKKITAGMLAGSVGAVVGNPFDLVNVRMQGDSSMSIEKRRNYKNVADGFVRVVREEGIATLWRGSQPNVLRAMFMTTAQLSSYDQIKQILLQNTNGMFKDNIITHFTAGSLAGFIATVVCSPVDVVKTKIFFSQRSSSEAVQYKGMVDCFIKTWKQDGIPGFFKGFSASFIRLVPQTILTVMFFEQYYNLLQAYRASRK